MNFNVSLLVSLILIFHISSGNGSTAHDWNPNESADFISMIGQCQKELSRGYEMAPRKSEDDISSEPSDVHFYLYPNPDDPSEFQEIFYNWFDKTRTLKADPSAPWKILIHGFLQDQNSSFPQLLVQEYLKRWKTTGERYNIMVVDWGLLAYSMERTMRLLPIYSKSVQNVDVAGQRVGDMITWLRRMPISTDPSKVEDPLNYFINDVSKLHIIGFSLGAHVAGKAGQVVRNEFSRRVGRITGLDPAGPSFYSGTAHSGRKLKPKDASSMDIIHTSWGTFGIGEEIGDADFYPNAGYLPLQIQPWCAKHWLLTSLVCSHNIAPVYFAFSINHQIPMEACLCGSWASYKTVCPCRNKSFMGEDWMTNQTGRYYLEIPKDDSSKRVTNVKQFMGLKINKT